MQSRLPASLRRLRAVQGAPTCLVIYRLSVQRSKIAVSNFLGSMLVNEISRWARFIFAHNQHESFDENIIRNSISRILQLCRLRSSMSFNRYLRAASFVDITDCCGDKRLAAGIVIFSRFTSHNTILVRYTTSLVPDEIRNLENNWPTCEFENTARRRSGVSTLPSVPTPQISNSL
jgi:hypothetical protein